MFWGYFNSNEELIAHLEATNALHSPNIKKALQKIPREKFVPYESKERAYADTPHLIGEGQTMSQPTTIVIMLELLQVKKVQKVLEIGSGGGWKTCLLAHLVGPKGKIIAYEIIPRVSKFGQSNIKEFPALAKRIHWETGDATIDAQEHALYDRIISGAAFTEIKKSLTDMLAENGRLVAPTQENDIRVITKRKGKIEQDIIPGFVFVPITH